MMSKRERLAALELKSDRLERLVEMLAQRVTILESDIRILRSALESYAETIKGLTGKIALTPTKRVDADRATFNEIQSRWNERNSPPPPFAHPNKWPIPPITLKAAEDANVPRRD